MSHRAMTPADLLEALANVRDAAIGTGHTDGGGDQQGSGQLASWSRKAVVGVEAETGVDVHSFVRVLVQQCFAIPTKDGVKDPKIARELKQHLGVTYIDSDCILLYIPLTGALTGVTSEAQLRQAVHAALVLSFNSEPGKFVAMPAADGSLRVVATAMDMWYKRGTTEVTSMHTVRGRSSKRKAGEPVGKKKQVTKADVADFSVKVRNALGASTPRDGVYLSVDMRTLPVSSALGGRSYHFAVRVGPPSGTSPITHYAWPAVWMFQNMPNFNVTFRTFSTQEACWPGDGQWGTQVMADATAGTAFHAGAAQGGPAPGQGGAATGAGGGGTSVYHPPLRVGSAPSGPQQALPDGSVVAQDPPAAEGSVAPGPTSVYSASNPPGVATPSGLSRAMGSAGLGDRHSDGQAEAGTALATLKAAVQQAVAEGVTPMQAAALVVAAFCPSTHTPTTPATAAVLVLLHAITNVAVDQGLGIERVQECVQYIAQQYCGDRVAQRTGGVKRPPEGSQGTGESDKKARTGVGQTSPGAADGQGGSEEAAADSLSAAAFMANRGAEK